MLKKVKKVVQKKFVKFYSLIGQPRHSTHPHLLSPVEISKGFPVEEFKSRIAKFCSHMQKNSIALIPSNMTTIMTHDIPYTFRQNSNFYYLTGFCEPGSLLVLEKEDYGSKATLLVRPKDPHRELWDGPRAGVDRAGEIFGFKNACHSIEDFDKMDFLHKGYKVAYYDTTSSLEMNDRLQRALEKEIKMTDRFHSSATILNKLKSIKSQYEIDIIRRTCDISAEAFKSAMKSTKPGMSEGHIEAILEFESRLRGAQRLAYPPVVATGNNGNIMHYVQNTQLIKDGDTLLVDAAAEYHMYPCDITRTWPANGKFSPNQKLLYEAVLDLQKKIILQCKPGMTFVKLHKLSVDLIKNALLSLEICTRGNVDELSAVLYPHYIGHPHGMDIHEANPVFEEGFVPGNMVTVEPGIYCAIDNLKIPEKWRGLAVRIEDDVLITVDGQDVLTKKTPKEVLEIESLMQENNSFSEYVFNKVEI
jgi:Xaa-Pro aminopeptidase